MCPTTKTARARQSQSDDPHTTRILMEIDLAVGVCGISEAFANLPGPAGAKAMYVSNFLSWTAHLVWSPISNKHQEIQKPNSRSRNINVSALHGGVGF